MDLDQLTGLVAHGESPTLELKRSTAELTSGFRTVCAMLNGVGGWVIFGVNARREIVGQDVGTSTLEDVSREVRKLDPPAFPEAETVSLASGKQVIALRVNGGGGPYTYDGRAYQRVGPTTSLMPRQQYERLLYERMHAASRWENQPAYHVKIEDLDQAEIIRTVEEAIRRQRLEDPGTRDVAELLGGLGVMENGELLNAAVVLFGKTERLLPHYPQCLLRLARFRGRDKTEFLDNRQEMGHAFDLFVRAQRFLRDHLPVAGRIVPNLFERIDDPLYPPAALREALANALCHRDYNIPGGAISIAIYDDRLEISSTGILPCGLQPEDLLRPHQSRPWNPIIAHAFYRRGIIESWGRGTLKMAELTEEAGLAPPEFEVIAGEVTVRFHPTSYVAPTRVGHDLSLLQRALLEALAATGPTSLADLRVRIPIPAADRTIRENLAFLRRLGLVASRGRAANAIWMLRGDSWE
jgi:ATP-dependent DNA helicase RecG